jgi:tRNA A-37 threonylcarbamoyl transferase component Bud32
MLLQELVKIELHYRWQRGQRPEVLDYLSHYPELKESSACRQELAEYAQRLGQKYGEEKSTLRESGPKASTSEPEIPRNIGKYVVVSQLDRGGQASVYRGVHPLLGKDVVIKLSHEAMPPDLRARDHLRAEGKILAELDHPNLARVYDFDFHDDRPFLVMEYVRGRTLEQFAVQERPSARREASLMAKAARALSLAHRRGIIHQDLKPRNILVDEAGEPRIIDFGLARLRHAWAEDPAKRGTISGTAHYMAPEQARGETDRVGPRSDIFAMGAVLYYLLSGRAPFAEATFEAALARAQRCDFDRSALERPGISRGLARICKRAMEEEPGRRYATAEAMAKDLEALVRRPIIWSAAMAALCGTAMAGVAIERGWFSPQTARVMEQRKMMVNVVRHDKWFRDLGDLVPLGPKDEIKIEIETQAPMYLALFLVNGKGELQLLREMKPGASGTRLVYPGESGAAPLSGPAGTDLLLALGRTDRPVTIEELRAVWPPGNWPAMTPGGLVHVTRDEVKIEQSSRDFGAMRDRPDPDDEIRRRLARLREQLAGTVEYIDGVAFPHQAQAATPG